MKNENDEGSGMDDAGDSREQRRALQEQIKEIKQQHREAEIERRKLIQEQIKAIMQQQKEQDEAHKKAVLEQIRELQRGYVEEEQERKQGLRDQIAEKMGEIQEEHVRKHHSNDRGHLHDLGDPEIRKGFLKLHILGVLKTGPTHGYEIMHRISHHTGHVWRPSPGSMYPALEALESKGFITCQGDGRRKVYSLTPKGYNIMDQLDKKRQEQFLEMKAFMASLLED